MADLRLARGRHRDVSEIELEMMERTLELASKAAAVDEVPVGAVICRGSRIIAEAFNTRESNRDPVGHAELIAISRAGRALQDWRLSGCTLVVTLEPCAMCAGAIINARIDRLIYGAVDPKAGACESLYRITTDQRLNHRVEVIGGVMADRSSRMLKDFFRAKRQRNRSRRSAGTA